MGRGRSNGKDPNTGVTREFCLVRYNDRPGLPASAGSRHRTAIFHGGSGGRTDRRASRVLPAVLPAARGGDRGHHACRFPARRPRQPGRARDACDPRDPRVQPRARHGNSFDCPVHVAGPTGPVCPRGRRGHRPRTGHLRGPRGRTAEADIPELREVWNRRWWPSRQTRSGPDGGSWPSGPISWSCASASASSSSAPTAARCGASATRSRRSGWPSRPACASRRGAERRRARSTSRGCTPSVSATPFS